MKKKNELENEKKEISYISSDILKLEQNIIKKKEKFKNIQKEIPFSINSSIFLGQDVNQTQYFVNKLR